MTAFNFPASAVANQEYTAPNGTVYRFDGQKWNVKSSSLATVATTGDYTDLSNTPEEYKFSIGADDSTLREVGKNESITIKGGNNISTSSDEEGNITITGEDGIVPGNTYDINISGDVVADDSTTVINSATGEITGNLTGDVTGSVLQDDSAVIVDGTSGNVTANRLTTTDQNVYFGNPEVARIRVHTETRQTLDQFDVFMFKASEYRSMKVIIQAHNTTDNEYYVSELLCLHDGTNSYTSEYSTIFTNTSDPDISVVAILNNGNFILRVTPAVNVEIDYKFIIQTMTT